MVLFYPFHVPATGGYDGVGNCLSVTATVNGGAPASYSGTTSYAYDYGQSANPSLNRSQLTQETSSRASGTFSYGYDGGTSGGPGNPTSFKGRTNTFNADNQITNSGYGYDGNGNPESFQGTSVYFDPENRLDGFASQNDYYDDDYTYDGDGHLQRTSQTAPRSHTSSLLYRLYDGDLPVVFYAAASNQAPSTVGPSTTETYGPDGLVSACATSTNSTNTSTFYTFDERGNVSQRLSGTGAVLSSDVYDAYGARTSTAAQADPVGFGGQFGYFTDSSFGGLILCTHRYYDPSAGRWLTRDPMGYGGGVNLYGYVGNDPGNRIDPTGFGFTEGSDPNHPIFCAFLGGVAGGVAGAVVAVTISGATGGAAAPIGVIAGGITAGATDQAVQNACNGDPPAKDMLKACAEGLASGLAVDCCWPSSEGCWRPIIVRMIILAICWFCLAATAIILVSYYWLHWSLYVSVPAALGGIATNIAAFWFNLSAKNKK